jgi:hypothetical protein
VAIALADLGVKEVERNTGGRLGGVPIDGNMGLEASRVRVYVTLFSHLAVPPPLTAATGRRSARARMREQARGRPPT